MTRFNFSRERGAVLIHVAVAMLGLLAFSALVIDYGIFWAARRQAQNSADAGALAGAMGLAYDDPDDFSDTGPAKLAARAAALANEVFGAPPDVNITTDVTFPPVPTTAPTPASRWTSTAPCSAATRCRRFLRGSSASPTRT